MTLYAFDAAYAPDLAALKTAGGIAVNCYVSGSYAVDAGWVAKVRTAGLGAWPNYERGLWELVSNRSAGQAAARAGITDAVRCKFPADGTIWFPFSVDVQLDPTQYNQVADAFRGIQDVNAGRYRISCYGQGGLISYLRAQNVITEKGWLSASYGFPGWDPASSDVCVWQLYGDGWLPQQQAHHPTISGTDTNIITDPAALGAWWPDGSPYGLGLSMADIQTILDQIAALRSDMNSKYQDLVQRIGEPTHAQTDSLRNHLIGVKTSLSALPSPPSPAEVAAAVKADPPAASVQLTPEHITAIVDGLIPQLAKAAPEYSVSYTASPQMQTPATGAANG